MKNIAFKSQKLHWKITSSGRKRVIQKLIFTIWIQFIVWGILVATVGYLLLLAYHFITNGLVFILQRIAYIVMGIMGGLVILFIINMIFSYEERSYFLNEAGLTIIKGKKKNIIHGAISNVFIFIQKNTKLKLPNVFAGGFLIILVKRKNS